MSGISNAYTVKSLPGAYLYIPAMLAPGVAEAGTAASNGEGADGMSGMNSAVAAAAAAISPSFSTTKRSLSDPEIHFAAPLQSLLAAHGSAAVDVGQGSPYPIILRVNPKLEQNGEMATFFCCVIFFFLLKIHNLADL